MPDPTQTAAALEAAKAAVAAAEQAHADAIAAAADPRQGFSALFDLLGHLVSRHGNHPVLEALLREFKAGNPTS